MSNAGNDVVTFRQAGDVTVAALQTGEITPKVSDVLQSHLCRMQAGKQTVKFVLDLSKLNFLGSVGLGALVVLLQRARKGDGQFALAGLTGLCRDVMRVTGMERAFSMYDDVTSALEALGHA